MTTDIPPGLGAGFDSEIGLEFLELTPDGGSARLQIDDKLLQPWGIVHGGVYCSIIESLASVSGQVWLTENGGGHVVGVNNNTDFLRAISVRDGDGGVDTDPPRPPPTAVADHHHRRQRAGGGAGSSAAAEPSGRVAVPFPRAAEVCGPWQYPRLCD